MAATHYTDPNQCSWWTEGIKTGVAVVSPLPAGTVLADSGNMPLGTYNLSFCIGSTVPVFAQIEWWNVDSTPVLVQSFAIAVGANAMFCDELHIQDNGHAVQVKVTTITPGLIGSIQATITNR